MSRPSVFGPKGWSGDRCLPMKKPGVICLKIEWTMHAVAITRKMGQSNSSIKRIIKRNELEGLETLTRVQVDVWTAIIYQRTECLQRLLQTGVDLNLRDTNGETAS